QCAPQVGAGIVVSARTRHGGVPMAYSAVREMIMRKSSLSETAARNRRDGRTGSHATLGVPALIAALDSACLPWSGPPALVRSCPDSPQSTRQTQFVRREQ